ncbi:MAG: DNA alkylation repair protein [Bacteroidales bacterium]|nr:DNA alkylation repair protein [Bacteroidales bacterium]
MIPSAMNAYVQEIVNSFEPYSNSENAIPMANYMKNISEFLGIKAPQRKEMKKQFIKRYGWPPEEILEESIRQLWELPYREYQYFAMEILDKFAKNAPKERIVLYEFLILNKSWWDTIDYIAPHLLGSYFKIYPEQIHSFTSKWINSENIWLQRSAILFQLKYKKDTHLELLYSIIERLMGSKEFFINKAIGWILREYSKINPNEIQTYVDTHPELSNLSKREALKVIERKTNT